MDDLVSQIEAGLVERDQDPPIKVPRCSICGKSGVSKRTHAKGHVQDYKHPGAAVSVQEIINLVHGGRITAKHGVMLLEYRRELAWKRESLWFRIMMRLLGYRP